jgi:hypothetical protein
MLCQLMVRVGTCGVSNHQWESMQRYSPQLHVARIVMGRC